MLESHGYLSYGDQQRAREDVEGLARERGVWIGRMYSCLHGRPPVASVHRPIRRFSGLS
jgi:hypothetical protein